MKTHLTSFLILISICLFGQSNWSPLEDFAGDSRLLPASFTIGTDVYLVGGLRTATNDPTQENWEYDADLDRWTPRQNYGGTPIWGAFSFVINDKAYVGTGDTGSPGANNYQSLVYEYNPATDIWDQKSSLGKRSQGVGFSINGKGYVVWGFESENGDKDESVIEFDPTDGSGGTWTVLDEEIPYVVDGVVIDGVPGIPFVMNGEVYNRWGFDK